MVSSLTMVDRVRDGRCAVGVGAEHLVSVF